VLAGYYVESPFDPELVAFGMAKEQSAGLVQMRDPRHNPSPAALARVVSVEVLGESQQPILPQYRLNTGVYKMVGEGSVFTRARICIAYPLINLNASLTNLWNVVFGELPRLGFLNAIRLVDLDIPKSFLANFPGPRHGLNGLRNMLAVRGRPLFCRSCRPAVGLDVEAMCAINEAVLRGGFDAVKDDELTVDSALAPYQERVTALARTTRRLEQETGERKLYFVNIIDDPAKSFEQLRIAEKAGADGVLIAPAIQGLAFAGFIAQRTELPIIAHNSVEDIFTRYQKFGVSPATYLKLMRMSGADLVFLPPYFGTAEANHEELQLAVTACRKPLDQIQPSLPIIAGGKQPDKLAEYAAIIGSPDFMVIAATSVDEYPRGLEAGARAFRQAWDRFATQS